MDNKKLIEEIDKLENEPIKEKTRDAIFTKKNKSYENILLAIIIGIIILCVCLSYNDFEIFNFSESGSSENSMEEYEEDSKVSILDFENLDDKNNVEDIEKTEIKQDKEMTQDEMKEKFKQQKEKIIVKEGIITKSNKLMVVLENQNSELIENFEVFAIFYDGNDQICKIDSKSMVALKPNSVAYVDFNKNIETFERYEIFIAKEYYYNSRHIFLDDYVKYVANKDEESRKILIDIKNNSNKKIDCISFSVVLYDKNNNIVQVVSDTEYDIKKNGKGEASIYVPWNTEYDRYEVVLNYAQNYNY